MIPGWPSTFSVWSGPYPGHPSIVARRAEVDRDAEQILKINPSLPDLVLVHRDETDPTCGIVITVEAQKETDRLKRWRLPVYQALLAEEYELQTWLVVISFCPLLSATMATWRDGPPPKVDTLVLDADVVPVPRSLEEARARPAAAILAAALQRYRGDLAAARLGVRVASELPEKRKRRYTATILAALPEVLRNELMQELNLDEYGKGDETLAQRAREVERVSQLFE